MIDSRKKWVFVFGLTGWIIIVAGLIAFSAPHWLPILLQKRLEDQLQSLSFEIESFSLQQTRLTRIQASSRDFSVSVPETTLTYRPLSAIRGQFQHLKINEPDILLSSLGAMIAPEKNRYPPSSGIPEWLQWIQVPLPDIPIQSVAIEDLRIRTSKGSEALAQANFFGQFDNAEAVGSAKVTAGPATLAMRFEQAVGNVETRTMQLAVEIDALAPLRELLTPLWPDAPASTLDQLKSLQGKQLSADLLWTSRELAMGLSLSQLGLPEVGTLEKMEWLARSTDLLQTIESHFSIEKLELADQFSTRVAGELQINDTWSSAPTVRASLNFNDLNLPAASENFHLDPVEVRLVLEEGSLQVSSPVIGTNTLPVNLRELKIHVPDLSNPTRITADGSIGVQGEGISLTQKGDRSASFELSLEGIGKAKTPQDMKAQFDGIIPASILEIDKPQTLGRIRTEWDARMSISHGSPVSQIDARVDLQSLEWNSPFGLDLKGQFSAGIEVRQREQEDNRISLELQNWEVGKTDFSTSLEGEWNGLPVALLGTRVRLVGQSPSPLTSAEWEIQAEKLQYDGWSVSDVTGTFQTKEDQLSASLNGHLFNPSLQVVLETSAIPASEQISAVLDVHSSDPEQLSSVQLHEYFSELQATLIRGQLKATLNLTGSLPTPDASLQLSLHQGEVVLPNSGIALSGVEIPSFTIQQLATGEGPGKQVLRIKKLEYPPATVHELFLEFQPIQGYGLMISALTFEFCEGSFRVDFDRAIEAPYQDYALQITFSGLELAKLTRLIPELKDEIGGKVVGSITLSFQDGTLAWESGSATLMEGESGYLRYAKDGFIAPYIPEMVLNKKLNLNIRDALRDITLTQMSIDFQGSDRFDEPSVVLLSGHSNHPEIKVPIEKIQLNIRGGDLPSLLNDSLKQAEWFQSIVMKKRNE